MTWNLDTIGVAIFLTGLVPWTIGGFISLRTRYEVHNRIDRMVFDPGGEPVKVSREEMLAAYFKNPSSRWWCIIGSSFALIGMAMLMLGFAMGGDAIGIIGLGVVMHMAFRVYQAAA